MNKDIVTWNEDPAHFIRPRRRDFLRVGVVGGLGFGLADLFRAQQASAAQKFYESKEGPAKSVIHVFLPGGMAQQESFDPKPYAPLEYRGDLGSVKTKTGEHFSSAMRRLAGIADKFPVIRSMTHTDAAHERAARAVQFACVHARR